MARTNQASGKKEWKTLQTLLERPLLDLTSPPPALLWKPPPLPPSRANTQPGPGEPFPQRPPQEGQLLQGHVVYEHGFRTSRAWVGLQAPPRACAVGTQSPSVGFLMCKVKRSGGLRLLHPVPWAVSLATPAPRAGMPECSLLRQTAICPRPRVF